MSEQSTQATKAHHLYRDLPFMLEEWQETILRERIANLLREHEEMAISSVLRIRCMNHMAVPQQNANEHSGGECGACIAEERDALKAKCEAPEKERDATWDALMEVETTFPEPWFSVGTPSDFAKHIKKRVENLKAKCEALERDYSALMTSLNAASKFACDMEKSQAGRIEALEKALREIADHKFLSYEAAEKGIYEGQYGIGVVDGHRACANIANAALAGGKETK